jgi:hypothetical protein
MRVRQRQPISIGRSNDQPPLATSTGRRAAKFPGPTAPRLTEKPSYGLNLWYRALKCSRKSTHLTAHPHHSDRGIVREGRVALRLVYLEAEMRLLVLVMLCVCILATVKGDGAPRRRGRDAGDRSQAKATRPRGPLAERGQVRPRRVSKRRVEHANPSQRRAGECPKTKNPGNGMGLALSTCTRDSDCQGTRKVALLRFCTL